MPDSSDKYVVLLPGLTDFSHIHLEKILLKARESLICIFPRSQHQPSAVFYPVLNALNRLLSQGRHVKLVNHQKIQPAQALFQIVLIQLHQAHGRAKSLDP